MPRAFFAVALVLGALVAALLVVFFSCSPILPPRSPSARELANLKARFPSVRRQLEQGLAVEWAGHRLMRTRDSLLAAGETLAVRRAEADYNARSASWRVPWFQRTYGGWDTGSDSLIYFPAWASRGVGFSAPWSSAGYVYSPSRRPPGAIGHLEGLWWLYSLAEDFDSGLPRPQRSQ